MAGGDGGLKAFRQPAEELAGSVSRVRDEPLRAEIEARFRPFDHLLGRLDLVVGACRRGFHIDDHCVLDIDQIVEAITELDAFVGLRRPC